jgi:hypothetical protein
MATLFFFTVADGGRFLQVSSSSLLTCVRVEMFAARPAPTRQVVNGLLFHRQASMAQTRRVGCVTFSINVTLDGCVDHPEGTADEGGQAGG